ncbi:MAG: 16S rRNA (guanine(966)-N(2))-methyltransferase RsmD [Acidimicrobiia bacterium]|nr:16S rRNA (guanine(966)-N(2))-methyltransferase RsmD [bacterium]MXX63503.1 16S rRNA (guanine(966)-N(2))-methyltransferase RsmD [Acidimicrobiia bacterium]MCY3580827.1 16S rRNA (guanine(966)-N(2))-methyltransferase RsmD [bacterium]MCY3653073.1 16S rRNA (guanine(966)-N(2))-methyltransferase RsmD [bacterium]MDE0644450.1 16S rRNA (guanine(966)-N(2))-methyltransferase RsmD [bacterium]
MRIIAGLAGGRTLRAPSGLRTRPMTDRARQALFSSMGSDFRGVRVLDLYAGTGSLGLEALSRGAAGAVFVEQDSAALEALRHNITALGIGGEVWAGEVAEYLVSARKKNPDLRFELIFVDPPYEMEIESVCKNLAAASDLLTSDGRLVLHRRLGESPPRVEGLKSDRTQTIGTARIRRYRKVE